MKYVFTIFSLLIFTSVFGQRPCVKCDIEKISATINHLDSLTFQIVSDFFCTFDTSCNNNVEFSEWSNEILYKVLEKSPAIFFQVISKGHVNNELLILEIESPIHEFSYQNIYNKVKSTNAPKSLKIKYMDALIVAASKENLKIIR